MTEAKPMARDQQADEGQLEAHEVPLREEDCCPDCYAYPVRACRCGPDFDKYALREFER